MKLHENPEKLINDYVNDLQCPEKWDPVRFASLQSSLVTFEEEDITTRLTIARDNRPDAVKGVHDILIEYGTEVSAKKFVNSWKSERHVLTIVATGIWSALEPEACLRKCEDHIISFYKRRYMDRVQGVKDRIKLLGKQVEEFRNYLLIAENAMHFVALKRASILCKAHLNETALPLLSNPRSLPLADQEELNWKNEPGLQLAAR